MENNKSSSELQIENIGFLESTAIKKLLKVYSEKDFKEIIKSLHDAIYIFIECADRDSLDPFAFDIKNSVGTIKNVADFFEELQGIIDRQKENEDQDLKNELAETRIQLSKVTLELKKFKKSA